MSADSETKSWLYCIEPQAGLLRLNLGELWKYRDLIALFVRRNIVVVYKQTILGPLWYLIQPLAAALVFTLIFNNIASISTGAVPPFLFNLAGVTLWEYFRECLTATSDTFKKNEQIFGKVYFPRAVVPIAAVLANLLKFAIQLAVFAAFWAYYYFQGADIRISPLATFFPVVVVAMGLLGIGLGMTVSSLVTKYRDLAFLLQFAVQLLMYLSAVVYPLALVIDKLPRFAAIVQYNPLSHVIEATRLMLLGYGTLTPFFATYTLVAAVAVFVVGLLAFNRAERHFIDTI